MARIYDNIDLQFTTGLQDIITNTGVKRVDFCVGYFNLRGWDLIIDQIDRLEGDLVAEREAVPSSPNNPPPPSPSAGCCKKRKKRYLLSQPQKLEVDHLLVSQSSLSVYRHLPNT